MPSWKSGRWIIERYDGNLPREEATITSGEPRSSLVPVVALSIYLTILNIVAGVGLNYRVGNLSPEWA